MQATAIAHPNIALVKYWGKRDIPGNLPAVGSISVTLRDLWTRTSVSFLETLDQDTFTMPTQPPREAAERVSRFLDEVRARAHIQTRARVESRNNFPLGAGLASSASAFAALAVAAAQAAGLRLSPSELSALARRGSGSAARSIFGGFVQMQVGTQADGSDAVAHQLAPENCWDLAVLVAVVSRAVKTTSSRAGMEHTAATSAYYSSWLTSSTADLEAMRQAIASKDLERLGEIAEHSCLKMHALIMAARPALLYWHDTTVRLMQTVYQLREERCAAYFTIDAGPQVKVLCARKDAPYVREALAAVAGVLGVIETGPGPGASLLGEAA